MDDGMSHETRIENVRDRLGHIGEHLIRAILVEDWTAIDYWVVAYAKSRQLQAGLTLTHGGV